jgi:hypothetical protein
MRKILLGVLLVSVIGTGVYLHRRKKEPVEIAYAASRGVTLWNTVAAIQEPVATVDYGTRLEVLQHFEDQAKVRAPNGTVGWTSESNLLTSEFWEQTKKLDQRTAGLPVEAHGETAVLTNLHIAPGRNAARILQLGKQVPVELFERKPMDVPQAVAQAIAQNAPNGKPAQPRREDWWLVRATLPDHSTASGWALGRFIQIDLPEALYDYASSADMRPVAWFVLDRVSDGQGSTKPQYLMVGTQGPEGQACDFTMLRVYTWSRKHQQYETAFVDSTVCGDLPIQIQHLAADKVSFSFKDLSAGAPAQAVYRLDETIVRRERQTGTEGVKRKRLHG